jgi:hypothetical protein
MKNKKGCVSTTAIKTKLKEEGTKSLKPSMRGLLEAVESFLQLTNMIGKARVNIARGLFHINMFSEMPVEEHIFDIKLANGSFVGHNKRENNTDSGSLDDRTKSVNVVKTRYLCVALGNKTGFETLDRTIGQVFGPKHPF